MRRNLPDVRFIDPASIQIGDVIKCVWKSKDIEHTCTGTVAKREYEGQVRVLTTDSGEELLRWVPGQAHARVTLLAASKEQNTVLELFDDPKQREEISRAYQ